MAVNKQNIQIKYYLNLALRYRWLIIIPFVISMAIGLFVVFTSPKMYSAQTLILVEPQRVPTNYVRSIVSSDIESRISNISQQIMSRTNIEKIINEYGLLSEEQFNDMYSEDKLQMIRKRILVKVTRARGADAFSVSFNGKDPHKVMNVANALASYFINENLKVREAQAVGTSDFLENEKTIMLGRLEQVEKALREYQTKHMGELPEQLNSNLNILGRLQEQLNKREERLSDAKYRLALLKKQSTIIPTNDGEVPVTAMPSDATDLAQLKSEYAMLKAKYTDRHPDVVKTKNLIKEMEANLRAATSQSVGEKEGPDSQNAEAGYLQSRPYQDIELEISTLKKDISELSKEIKYYQARVEATPKREQELMSLTRDYNNILSSYNSLLNRKLEAEIAVNMEKKQKGEQFRIIDPAKLPEKPISPNVAKLFAIFFIVGLGSGCAIIFIIDFMDLSFKSKEDLEAVAGTDVLITIPVLQQPKMRKWRVLGSMAYGLTIAVSAGLFLIFSFITIEGIDRSTELAFKIIGTMR